MRFLIGVIVGIVIDQIGIMRIAESLQQLVDMIKSLV